MTYFAQITKITGSNLELTFSLPNIISVSREYFINTFAASSRDQFDIYVYSEILQD